VQGIAWDWLLVLIENLHPGNLARTQDKSFLQKEAVSLKESPSQNVTQPTPTSEEIPHPPDSIPQDFSAHLFPALF